MALHSRTGAGWSKDHQINYSRHTIPLCWMCLCLLLFWDVKHTVVGLTHCRWEKQGVKIKIPTISGCFLVCGNRYTVFFFFFFFNSEQYSSPQLWFQEQPGALARRKWGLFMAEFLVIPLMNGIIFITGAWLYSSVCLCTHVPISHLPMYSCWVRF